MTEKLLLGFRCLIMSLTGLNPLIITYEYVFDFYVCVNQFIFFIKLLPILCCCWVLLTRGVLCYI
jgi:hypothetical protein